MAAIDQNSEVSADSSEALAETIKGLQETDLVAINGDTRTYHVSDVIEQDGEDGDGYDERYVIRLEWYRDDGRLALVLEEGANTNIEVHVLQDNRLPGEGGTYDVEEIVVIPTDLEWVIHFRNRNRYHRPDPEAARRGEAEPVCGSEAESADPKFRRLINLHTDQRACARCFRDFDEPN